MPVVAIVGRPNVGKSTLFNRLIRQRKAIVGDKPGVTVDRLEGEWKLTRQAVTLVDTGGIGHPDHGDMQAAIEQQVEAALDVADLVLFVVDAQTGVAPVDQAVADKLRRQQIPMLLIVNKAEKPDAQSAFYELGLGEPLPVSAQHGQGISQLCQQADELVPSSEGKTDETAPLARIAVIGRPNVGKSTLINAWLGRDRMVVSKQAGTTRDAVDADLPFHDGFIRLIDTAGQRKHGRIKDVVEFVGHVKARQALSRAEAAVLLLDGAESIVEQDLRLLHLAMEEGCAVIMAVNKVDLLSKQAWQQYAERLSFRMRAYMDLPVMKTAAAKKRGIKQLLAEAVKAAERNRFTAGTGELNRWLKQAQSAQSPPGDRGALVRMKYCTQVTASPPVVKVFCNRPKAVKESYIRYLENNFRYHFRLNGVPVQFVFSASENPYAKGRKVKA